MNVVDLRLYRDPAYTPVVIFIDTQLEYVAENRALELEGAPRAVENCKALLAFARSRGYPVAFTRWQQNGKFFGRAAHTSGWIPGLSPSGNDMVFDRSLPSCYANEQFAEMMDRGGGANAIIAGFTGTIACLSTVVDAYQRQHSVAFVADASASHALPGLPQDAAHEAVTQIIALYGPVKTTAHWINERSATPTVQTGAVL
jgi:nicotinamidase-related amidase